YKGGGLGARAVHERQSLLIPNITPEAVEPLDLDPDYLGKVFRLNIVSAMAIPVDVRGQLTGALVLGSTSLHYDQEALKFAERYASRIGIALDNARLYQQAQEAVRARDEFLSLVSHELRTPITGLRLSAQTLARKASQISPGSMAELSERILRQSARLGRLADRLLDTCEIGAGGPSIDAMPLDLVELVRDVAHAFRETASREGSEIVVNGDGDLMGAFDPIRLEQVISNLL